MRYAISFIAVSVVAITSMTCHQSTPPPITCDYPSGNRSFTWRTDTVAWWPSEVGGVWAFSDTDAYVMGNMSGPTVTGQRHYPGLHWNGRVWDTTLSWNGLFQNNPRTFANDVAGDDHFMVAAGFYVLDNEKAAVEEFDNRTKKWVSHQFETPGMLYSVWTDGKGYFMAAGENGMIYTKDGYSGAWIYSKAPTTFSFTDIVGISKTEVYAAAFLSLATGQEYEQYWKYDGTGWRKLFDNQDTSGNVFSLPGDYSTMTDIAASRCSATDSLTMYLTGWESYRLESKGQSVNYSIANLSSLGLPLHDMGRTAYMINLITPKDVWIFGTQYNFYHWNGMDYQQIVIPGLPSPNSQYGQQRRIVKTSSGKVFLPSEVSSQVYVVVQGTP